MMRLRPTGSGIFFAALAAVAPIFLFGQQAKAPTTLDRKAIHQPALHAFPSGVPLAEAPAFADTPAAAEIRANTRRTTRARRVNIASTCGCLTTW